MTEPAGIGIMQSFRLGDSRQGQTCLGRGIPAMVCQGVQMYAVWFRVDIKDHLQRVM